MRRYENEQEKVLTRVVCNQCGKELQVEKGYLKEGCFHGDAVFGYFSRKDGIRHQFDLCEDCYDKMIGGFSVAPEECENTELL